MRPLFTHRPGTQGASDSLEAARLAGLRETWVYARKNSRYYADILPERDPDTIRLADLASLPVCTADVLRDRCLDLRCKAGVPSFMLFTGGSTGLPRIIFGDEGQLPESLHEKRVGDASRPMFLTLTTADGHHGAIPRIPGKSGSLQVPLRNRKNYLWAWQLLSQPHRYDGQELRVSAAFLPLPSVKKLTHFILENGFDTSQLALRFVTVFAWYLSTRWRERIQTVLNTRVLDCYGFTEMFYGLANECPACGHVHFGEQVVWELVDPFTGAPTKAEVGKILCTSLVPYAQDHVLIRFDPGDLVRLGPPCDWWGEPGLRPLGRQSLAVSVGSGATRRWVLFPTDVQEAVDLEDWIARSEETRFSGVTRSSDDAFPKWRIRHDAAATPPVIDLDIELKFSPQLFADRWDACRETVESRLMSINKELARALAKREIELRINGLPPGSIPDDQVCIC